MKPQIINITNPECSEEVSRYITVGAEFNTWMQDTRDLKPPLRIFDNFWHRYELAVCFGDSDYDKSILATQLVDCISRGTRLPGIGSDMPPRPALLIDQQSSGYVIRQRYSPYGRDYRFGDRAFRAVIKETSGAIAELDKDCLPELVKVIETYRNQEMVNVVIINALSRSVFEGAGVNSIRLIMKTLRGLAAKYSLSIMLMVPSFKRDVRKPFDPDRHYVARTIMAAADAAFFMGRSCTDPGLGYFRHLKSSVIDLEAVKDPKQKSYVFYDSPFGMNEASRSGSSSGEDAISGNDGADHWQMSQDRERYEDDLVEMEGGYPGSAKYSVKPGFVWNYAIRRRDRFIRIELLDVEEEREHFSKWDSPYKYRLAKSAKELRDEGKSWGEIARRLDMPVSSVRDLFRDGPPPLIRAFEENDKMNLQWSVKVLKESAFPKPPQLPGPVNV